MKKAHRSSNWKNLKRLASNRSKKVPLGVSGAHTKVGKSSRAAAGKAIIVKVLLLGTSFHVYNKTSILKGEACLHTGRLLRIIALVAARLPLRRTSRL
mgnify:CR=1 FL=1